MSGWKIGGSSITAGDRAVVLDLESERASRDAGAEPVRIDRLIDGDLVEFADDVIVEPPTWRGHSFIELCEWLVCARLGRPGRTRVHWITPRRGGATGVRRVLGRRGWHVEETRKANLRIFDGVAVEPGSFPEPHSFTAGIGERTYRFAADWGVFSQDHVDDGTRLLFDTVSEAIARGPGTVASVADVGTGYGALAIALTGAGLAAEACASDVDFLSLYLARRNAADAGVGVNVVAEADPKMLPGSHVTVSFPPTHVPADRTKHLIAGLAARAAQGLVLIVVHGSLASRYTELVATAGVRARTVAETTHAVLAMGELPG